MQRRTAAVTILVALAAVLVSVLWAGPLANLSRPPGLGPTLGLLTLTLMFAATEAVVLHVQIRSEAQTLSLSEIPMVLGLAFAAPHVLGLARLLGAAGVLLVYRRQPPLKFLYNLAVQAAEVSVGIAVYTLVRAAATPTSARGAIATLVAVVVLNLLSGWCLQFVVGLSEGEHRLGHYLREALVYPPIACGTAMFGLVALHALRNDNASVVPLLGCLAVLLLAYRFHSRLSRRHLGLERLHQFTQAVSHSPEAEQVLRSVLRQARVMANAEWAEIGLLDEGGHRSALILLSTDDVLRRDELGLAEPRLGCIDTSSAPKCRACCDAPPAPLPKGGYSTRAVTATRSACRCRVVAACWGRSPLRIDSAMSAPSWMLTSRCWSLWPTTTASRPEPAPIEPLRHESSTTA